MGSWARPVTETGRAQTRLSRMLRGVRRAQMAAALPQEPQTDADLLEAYQQYLRTLRLRQTKFGYVLPVALVPTALSLDWLVYPGLVEPILASRIWCNLVLTPCWVLAFTKYARRFLWFLGNAWLWSPMV